MTPSQIQELRELADALQTQADWLAEYQHHWTACEQDAKFLLQIVTNVREAYPALRACADREERAQAGITDELVMTTVEMFYGPCRTPSPQNTLAFKTMKQALQSAALALQGDRDQAFIDGYKAGASGFIGEGDGELQVAAEQRLTLYKTADLSRAIGDEK